MKNTLITILAEVYNIDPKEGIEFLTYNVRVATDIDDWSPKYSYTVWEKEKAYNLAEKIHRDQRTSDLIFLYA